jgi:cell division protein FtsI (penicillin-binding protein 3)
MRRPVSSVKKPAVPRAIQPQDKARRKRRHRLCLLLIILLLAGGVWLLRRLQFSFADAGTMLRHAFSEEQSAPVPAAPPPAPLRGAIYDRNLEEMAVSYRLYSLQAHPAELADRQRAAERLAATAGADAEELLRRLSSGEQTVELTVGMDAEQANAVEELRLPGVSCRPVEARYYPGHAAAGRLLGFVSEGAGLSGIEALCDNLLQPGAFRPADALDIDFSGQTSVGPQAADLLLTLDFKLQKRLEEEFDAYRQQTGAVSGSAIVLDPETGRLAAAIRQPGFDPNYFWQIGGQTAMPKEDGPLFPADFYPELLRPLLNEAGAATGLDSEVVPAAVSPPISFGEQDMTARWREFGFDQPAPELLPLDPKHPVADSATPDRRLNAADIAVGAAVLLNGGKRVTPWFLHAVYDPDRHHFFSRSLAASPPQRLVAPAAGVQLRRRLLHDSFWASSEGFLYVNSSSAPAEKNGLFDWHVQDVLIAAVPQEKPRLLLALVIEHGALYPPLHPEQGQNREMLAELGRRLLPVLAKHASEETALPQPPAARNETNLRRFLLSRRLNRPAAEEKEYELTPQVMPDVVGLSLRQALRRLNPHKLRVQIKGSGRVAAQKPAANASLAKIETCELTLKPLFQNEQSAPAPPQPATRTARKIAPRPAGKPDQQNHP